MLFYIFSGEATSNGNAMIDEASGVDLFVKLTSTVMELKVSPPGRAVAVEK